MNKYWAVLFLAIAIMTTIIYTSEKEYTVRHCEFINGWYEDVKRDCNDCNEEKGVTKKFKVSKHLNSIMQTNITADDSIESNVVESCKIFDENNFECKTETEAIFGTKFYNFGTLDDLVVSNGKWEYTFVVRGEIDKTKKLKKGEKNKLEGKSQSYSCGYEIKNVFNFFK
jgi:hypothetical protein